MAFDISFRRPFKHRPRVDAVDRVTASGDNGFNVRPSAAGGGSRQPAGSRASAPPASATGAGKLHVDLVRRGIGDGTEVEVVRERDRRQDEQAAPPVPHTVDAGEAAPQQHAEPGPHGRLQSGAVAGELGQLRGRQRLAPTPAPGDGRLHITNAGSVAVSIAERPPGPCSARPSRSAARRGGADVSSGGTSCTRKRTREQRIQFKGPQLKLSTNLVIAEHGTPRSVEPIPAARTGPVDASSIFTHGVDIRGAALLRAGCGKCPAD